MQKRRLIPRSWGLETLESRLLLSATVNDIEPNSRTPQQFAVPEDGLVHILGTANGRNDKDFFRFVAPSSGLLAVTVATPQGGLVQAEIETARSAQVLETEPNDGVNEASVQLEAGQTYIIRLRSKSKTGTPSYDVTLQFDATPGGGGGGGGGGGTGGEPRLVQETESNDSKSSANAFTFPDTNSVQIQGISASKRDSDYFVFTAAASGTIQASLSASGSIVQLEVETAGGANVFETEPNDGVDSGSFRVQQGVKYYIRLRSKSTVSSTYQVDLVLAADPI